VAVALSTVGSEAADVSVSGAVFALHGCSSLSLRMLPPLCGRGCLMASLAVMLLRERPGRSKSKASVEAVAYGIRFPSAVVVQASSE
jgi:hypothetical protein